MPQSAWEGILFDIPIGDFPHLKAKVNYPESRLELLLTSIACQDL